MPQPTILNLDELRVTRSVVIGGRERVLRNMTVEQFVQAGDLERKLEAAGSERAQIPLLVELIADHLDDTPREDILGLDLEQLLALLAFIRGLDPAGREPPPGEPRAGRQRNRRTR